MRTAALAVPFVALSLLTACSNESAPAATTPPTPAASAAPATTAAAAPFTIVGSIALTDSFVPGPGGVGCEGDGGYSDITTGGVVTVSDASGTIVAVGSIKVGAPTAAECTLFFEVTDVPASPFYQIEVTNRGLVTFTDAQARGGEVMLSLG